MKGKNNLISHNMIMIQTYHINQKINLYHHILFQMH